MENLSNTEISQLIFQTLTSLSENENSLVYQGKGDKGHFLRLTYENYQVKKSITLGKAFDLIYNRVKKESPTKGKPLFLYVCGDNGEIVIEHSLELKNEEINLFDKQADNFYIGWD